jgi:endonuclease/exonuclease/phosphatase family metal-dependent hydrolase
LNYSVAGQVENADVELPAARSATEFFDVRLTDRDVILAREGVNVAASGSGGFNTLAPIPVGGQVMEFPRGYVWAQVTVDDVSFMFVNSHLEVSAGGQLQPVQVAQSYELTAGFGRTSPIVMVGDFNSAPGAPPYNILNASFMDAWSAVGSGEGLTCCQPEVLLQTGTLNERIDLVLYRGAIDALSVQVLGNEQADRTSGGLWPSDHAGVAATLQIRE